MALQKIITKNVGGECSDHVGQPGDLFYDSYTRQIQISDGETLGGLPIIAEGNANLGDVAVTESRLTFGHAGLDSPRNHASEGDRLVLWDGINPITWLDFNSLPSGGSYASLRGATIEYHAVASGHSSVIGQIMMVNDGSPVTNHHEIFNDDSHAETYWTMIDNTLQYTGVADTSYNVMVQWTAKIFYGPEITD